MKKQIEYLDFNWICESKIEHTDEGIAIFAPDSTDYFNSPVREHGHFPSPVANAPIYYTKLTGDFVFRAQLRVDFKNTFDAGALMVYENKNLWGKLAFEKSDMPGNPPSVVSVITNRFSDDCNNVPVSQDEVWFQISRADDCFAFHYSLDGKTYMMVRLFTLPVGDMVKVGFEAQSPLGEGGYRYFKNILIRNIRLENLRTGKFTLN